jgi:predicted 3-demethylubiquinone-9 3-methyltransferase (glyoxalase superfamily)
MDYPQESRILPFLWFKDPEEAVTLYTSVFREGKIDEVARHDGLTTIRFSLEGQTFLAMSGETGTATPAISFFVYCKTEVEIDNLWQKLSDAGGVLMELAEYPWSKKFGWLNDKYGVSWQLVLQEEDSSQKILPYLMFVRDNHGRASEAISHYTSIFQPAETLLIMPGSDDSKEIVQFAKIKLQGQEFIVADSGVSHAFNFSNATSLAVQCKNQAEIDYFWEKLCAGGKEGKCGWLEDKFGVSWQVVPVALGEMMASSDQEKVRRVTKAMREMVKLDLAVLEQAFNL